MRHQELRKLVEFIKPLVLTKALKPFELFSENLSIVFNGEVLMVRGSTVSDISWVTMLAQLLSMVKPIILNVTGSKEDWENSDVENRLYTLTVE